MISARWLDSEEFRLNHALSPDYFDMEHHTPRCAWDWMLTPPRRVHLAKFQTERMYWLFNSEFNFGPILCRERFSPAALTSKNYREYVQVEPLPNAPPPLTVNQAWDCAPDLFKKAFRLACGSTCEFGEVNERLRELARILCFAANKLAAGDPLQEAPLIAHHLFLFGSELRDLAEFSKVFKIPKRRCSEKLFKCFLDQIHHSFKASDLLVPTKTYDTHESYQGTAEDWRWFLEAERLGLDIRKSGDLAMLSERYCEELRQRAMRGKAPPRTKAHGLSGTNFSSAAIKNRRSVVKRHVLAIDRWIRAAFPRRTSEPTTSAS